MGAITFDSRSGGEPAASLISGVRPRRLERHRPRPTTRAVQRSGLLIAQFARAAGAALAPATARRRRLGLSPRLHRERDSGRLLVQCQRPTGTRCRAGRCSSWWPGHCARLGHGTIWSAKNYELACATPELLTVNESGRRGPMGLVVVACTSSSASSRGRRRNGECDVSIVSCSTPSRLATASGSRPGRERSRRHRMKLRGAAGVPDENIAGLQH
jgi:hypothetical protein